MNQFNNKPENQEILGVRCCRYFNNSLPDLKLNSPHDIFEVDCADGQNLHYLEYVEMPLLLNGSSED